MKLLIATTNKGKYKEIAQVFETLPYVECVSLDDLDERIEKPEETEDTVEGNALLKAKYYSEKSGMLTLADDTGLFIEALDGWPGVRSGRIAKTEDEQSMLLLSKLEDIPDRRGYFQGVLVLHNPKDDTLFVTTSEVQGTILEKMPKQRNYGHGYDPIFFIEEQNKTLDEMSIIEKNSISHRGKNLSKFKYHIQHVYGGKHFVVPLAIIVNDGKVLMNKRNDPHNLQFHELWEFPGGCVELGESVEENVIREVKEETGYDVEIVQQLRGVIAKHRKTESFEYQVYLIRYVCKIVGGDGVFSDDEVLESKWIEIDDVVNQKSFPDDNRSFDQCLPELKEVVKTFGL